MVSILASPFTFTGPAPAQDVVGREELIEAILNRAVAGKFMRLTAPRRFGKTSLIGRIASEAAAGNELVVARVDLMGVDSLDDVAARCGAGWVSVLPVWERLARRALRHVNVSLTPGGIGVQIVGDVGDGSPQRRLESVLATPVEAAARSGRKVLVVFDEFQAIAHVPEAAAVIRSQIQHHGPAVSYLFAGSEASTLDLLFTDRAAPLYGQAEPIELGTLPPGPLTDFIIAKFEATNLELDDAALDALVRLCAGHPQRSMLLAHHLWEQTVEGGSGIGTIELFDAAHAAALGWLRPEFDATISTLSTAEVKLLRTLAWGEPPFGAAGKRIGLMSSSAQAAMRSLDGGQHLRGRRLVDPLLADWLRSINPRP